MSAEDARERYARGMEHLVEVVQRLSLATDLAGVVAIVRTAARELTGADGATFVLREGDRCHYVDEDAIGPLWRGQRFPLDACVSGWAMRHGQPVVIEDISRDSRVPADAYAPTFVKSLVMVPIRVEDPIGAIGNYWATRHSAEAHEVKLLQSLAHSTSVVLKNLELISSLRNSLAETRAARDELERQLRLRDDFVALASHELRTPLTPLSLQMHVLRAAVNQDGERASSARIERAVSVSERQLTDLGALTERMLDASRVSLGRFDIEADDGVDLADVARKVVDEHASNGVPLRLAAEHGVVGRWDAARLETLVRILVDNARKFGGDADIDVRVFRDGAEGCLEVRDRGIGIASRDHERIFERFERAAPTTSYRGLGLGLYIGRAIATAHRGRLTLASAPGEGAVFTVHLPVQA